MPRTFCNYTAAAIARIEALLGWLLTTSYDFDTASTGIQEPKASERKPQIEKEATYASALTKAVYVLYGLLETNPPSPQKYFLHSVDGRCRPQACG